LIGIIAKGQSMSWSQQFNSPSATFEVCKRSNFFRQNRRLLVSEQPVMEMWLTTSHCKLVLI
jgi:hypothetical protein